MKPLTCRSKMKLILTLSITWALLLTGPLVHNTCVAVSICPETPLSINLGFFNFSQTDLCCDQDHCNNRTLQEILGPNGLMCPSCSSVWDMECTNFVSCIGVEDGCIDVKVTGETDGVLKGCASTRLCSEFALYDFMPSFLPSVTISGVSCTSTASRGPVSDAVMAMLLLMMVKLAY